MSIAKILLVDDEKPFVETMMKRLKKRDVDVAARLRRERSIGVSRKG